MSFSFFVGNVSRATEDSAAIPCPKKNSMYIKIEKNVFEFPKIFFIKRPF